MANTSESKSSSARKERRKEWWMKKNNSKKAESGEGIKLRVRQPKTETDRQASVIETQHGFKLKLKLNSNNTSLPKASRKTLKPPAKPRAKAAPPKATSTALSSKPPSTTKKKEPKAKASDVIANTCATSDPIKPKTYVLFVGNLPFDVTKEQLLEHFRKTGGAKSVRIPKEKGTDKGRGFAYIQFRDHISFRVGLRLHQTTLAGRKINVEFTSIGGNNKNRREKLKAKNKALEKLKQSVDKDS